jgi:hypothetical protein
VSSIAITGGATGTGTVILLAPNTNTNQTLTLPDVTDTVAGIAATQTLTNKTLTTPNINSAQFATVSGTAPIYPCRAWVNFNGTGTVAIRASGNVTSITDNGTGNYTVNFTTAMPDADFAAVCIAGTGASANQVNIVSDIGRSTTTFALLNAGTTGAGVDRAYINVVIFR